jgi:hypothetical protein
MTVLYYSSGWRQGTAMKYDGMEIAAISRFSSDFYDHSSGYIANLKIGVP